MTISLGSQGLASPKILVTGASGFIGAALMSRLVISGFDVEGAARRPSDFAWGRQSPSLGDDADWRPLLEDRTVVIHAAARAHILTENASDPISVFRAVNTDGTRRLAEQAAEMGVRRFVFLSSIGVNGVQSGCPFTESDRPEPQEPYAVSKYEAEKLLLELASKTGMEVVILRPPLVYGPGAPGNFGRLLGAVKRGLPLPLGAITENRRSLVALDNLVDLIVTCIDHPAAANQIFLVSDGEDLSTATLLRRLGHAIGKPVRLIPVPEAFLTAALTLIGREALAQRLCGSLQVDSTRVRDVLGWVPPISVDEGLSRSTLRCIDESNNSSC